MISTKIELPDSLQESILEIANLTGQSQQELMILAIQNLIDDYRKKQRLNLMRQAKGMWADREDLPNLDILRDEFNR